MDEVLNVTVITPRRTLYQGEALAVSSTNSRGKFDILPEHANFITLIENQPIIIQKKDKQTMTFKFLQAIIYVAKNQISIFAEPQIS